MRRKNGRKSVTRAAMAFAVFLIYLNFVTPSNFLTFIAFYILAACSVFFTLKIITDSANRAGFWSLLTVTYLLLRQYRLENILNTLILAGLALTMELYFRKS